MNIIRRIFSVLEIVAVVVACVLAVLWLTVPGPNWRAWIALCAALTAGLALIGKRLIPRAESQTSTADWLKHNVHTAKLSVSLPRALEFAKSITSVELERWVRLELYGYNEEGKMTAGDTVPKYRRVTGRWMDRFDRTLDISGYPELSIINEYPFRFGVGELEDLASRNKMQNVTDDYSTSLLREHLDVEMARFMFNPIAIRGVLDTIRNKLAEKVLGCLSDDKSAA